MLLYERVTSFASAQSGLALTRINYNAAGMHLSALTRHVDMPTGSLPVPNGEPATGVNAPLAGSIV